ncbi:50S ribosomal protein L11 methyltransferase [Acidihalobacter prosperus]
MSTNSNGAESPAARIELRVRATAEQAWALSETLDLLGALSVALEPLEDSAPQLEPAPGTTPLWPELELSALFAASDQAGTAMRQLRGEGLDPVLAECPERDWVAVGRAGLEPFKVGDRLWIVPEWCDAPATGVPTVRIAPGLAFGTGSHPTTALCLEWLAGHDLAGKRVIDYGAGSGILGLAAARLGAAEVTAVDNEPQALVAVRANAELNALKVTAVAPGELAAGKADVIVANILARPLVALAPVLLGHLSPRGHLVLSGITRGQADVVAAAYAPDARVTDARHRGDWVCMELRRD